MHRLEAMRAWMKSRKGQNTVEYLMMLGVIVGIVLVVGATLKNWLPGMFQTIAGKINGAINSTSAGPTGG